MAETSLIASLITPLSMSGAELASLPGSVECLEVRADLLGDLNPEWLRDHFRGRLLYVLRSQAEGGEYADSLQQRHDRLARAAHHYDLIEIESGTDFSATLLAQIPIEKRVVAWHGATENLTDLKARFAQLSSVPAALYKLVARTKRISDELNILTLLKSLGRADTIAYADGPLGFWTRLMALHLGSPAIFGLVPDGSVIPTEPTITKLIHDYGLPKVMPIKEIFAIIGSPVFHSLSPRLHNAAYRALGYSALFVPLQVESFDEFWQQVVQSRVLDSLCLPLNGMTVASPHKEAALLIARAVSPMSRQAGSANVLVRNNGSWKADTTDPDVIYTANRERGIQVKHKRAAVIGCGGAGRAIAAGLARSGAGVTLINRGAERGHHAARLLDLPYISLRDFDAEGFDIVVNATPVGRDSNEVPFKLERLNSEAVVIDLVYGARPTPLVGNSVAREQIVIDGRDVLLTQVRHQFRMMTGSEMPVAIATEALGRRAPLSAVVSPLPALTLQSASALGTDVS